MKTNYFIEEILPYFQFDVLFNFLFERKEMVMYFSQKLNETIDF